MHIAREGVLVPEHSKTSNVVLPLQPLINPCHSIQKRSSDPRTSCAPLSHSNIPPCPLPQRKEISYKWHRRGLPKLIIYVNITPQLKLATEGPVLAISSGTSADSDFCSKLVHFITAKVGNYKNCHRKGTFLVMSAL